HHEEPRRARSTPYSDSGRSIVVQARRWPALHCVWRDGGSANAIPRECEPSGRGATAPRPHLPQPEGGDSARAEKPEQDEDVPGEDRAERALERPGDPAERPARKVPPGLGLRR